MKRHLFYGALGGAIGAIAMKAIVRFIDRDSFGLSAKTDAKTAHEIWRRFNWRPIDDRQAERVGAALHYGFSVAAGAFYAAAAPRFPAIRAARGAAFGSALWLLGDEIAVSVSGLENPFETPVASHLSALGAHIVFGMSVDAMHPSGRIALNVNRQDALII
jgi:hypothetical protein